MAEPAQPKLKGFARAWLVVFAATLVTGVAACWSRLLASHLALLYSPTFNTTPPTLQAIMQGALTGVIIAAPVGVVSATICAPLLLRRPAQSLFATITLVSMVVGILASPCFHIFSAVLVVAAQVVTSVILFKKHDGDSANLRRTKFCANCKYSLRGLDRAQTDVCPECGAGLEPLPR
jgi:hypothetical protein